jgi:hypothetical protein
VQDACNRRFMGLAFLRSGDEWMNSVQQQEDLWRGASSLGKGPFLMNLVPDETQSRARRISARVHVSILNTLCTHVSNTLLFSLVRYQPTFSVDDDDCV